MFGYGIDKKTLYIVGKGTTLLSLSSRQMTGSRINAGFPFSSV